MPSVPSTNPSPSPSRAGIIESPTGSRHIPSSLRPDGSQRREIKIRPGYRPPEDVEVYKNRTAEGFRTRGKGGIPGAGGLKDDDGDKEGSAASEKNKKRREARKRAKENEGGKDGVNGVNGADGTNGAKGGEGKKEDKKEEEVDPEVEKEKKARALKKKLKQARELKEKKEGGASLLPEQFAKVIKINELIRELDALGFDAEGEKKEAKSEGGA